MSASLAGRLHALWGGFVRTARTRERGTTLLDRKRIYVLPTRSGIALGITCLLLFFSALHFQLQLGYLLAFFVLSVWLVSLYRTHRNIAHLSLRGLRATEVYSGEVADFEISVENPLPEARWAVHLQFLVPRRRRESGAREPGLAGVTLDIPAQSSAPARIGLPTRRRGLRSCPRIRVSSRFPFGLWVAWAYCWPELDSVVFPVPESDPPPLPLGAEGDFAQASAVIAGSDDFAGVRPYRPGDPRKSIAWRLAARSEDLAVKMFESSAGALTVLDFARAGAGLDTEARLSRLAAWVLGADAAGVRYCLRLPGLDIPIGTGPEHRRKCLEALAMHGGRP